MILRSRLSWNLQAGFTLIELTIALAILSSLLLIGTYTFIAMIRQQQAIISMRTTNQVARSVLDDFALEARVANRAQIVADPVTNFPQICLYQSSQMLQYYVVDLTSSGGRSTLYKAKNQVGTACKAIPPGAIGNQAVTSTDTDIVSFNAWRGVTAASVATKPENVTLSIGVTTDIALTSSGVCLDTNYSYCSVSTLESSANLRGDAGVGP